MAAQLPHRPALRAPLPVYEPTEKIDVDAWADEAAGALQTVSITPSKSARGTSVTLAIPLDEESPPRQQATKSGEPAVESKGAYKPRREPLRRDSLKRREALLKGKEGSRRRQRWENDRLLNNPWAQPPLPSDWEVQPTYPRYQEVPYFLAPLWDATVAERRAKEQKHRNNKVKRTADEVDTTGHISKELREKLKRAKAARGLLMDLEEQIRSFVEDWEQKQNDRRTDGLADVDSEEDEIVFVGRNGQMHDLPPSPKAERERQTMVEELKREKLVFDSLADDHSASFGRWLVHSLATYYGLRTWSVTTGKPARREAYVGIRQVKTGADNNLTKSLPRPLWGMV